MWKFFFLYSDKMSARVSVIETEEMPAIKEIYSDLDFSIGEYICDIKMSKSVL